MTSLTAAYCCEVGLVGVDADRALAGSLGSLEDAAAGAACGVVDDVGTRLVHAVGSRLALVDGVEAGEVGNLREVLDLDLDVRLDGLRARDVASLELLDEGRLDAADEADGVALRLEGSRGTDEEGALVLGERDLLDVRTSGVGRRIVDDRELDVRVVLGDLADRLGVGEADGDDVVEASVDELLRAAPRERTPAHPRRPLPPCPRLRNRPWPCRVQPRRRR